LAEAELSAVVLLLCDFAAILSAAWRCFLDPIGIHEF